MGVVARVSGPVVIAEGLGAAKMFDVVRVGDLGLVGEIIRLVGDQATVQVYEDTTGIRPGDKVENTGQALSVDLGPGLLKSIYDGVQRPLDVLKQNLGDFIARGFSASALDEKKSWQFDATVKRGDEVSSGAILGTVQETPLILHKVLVPPGVRGTVEEISSGSFTIRDKIGSVKSNGGSIPLSLAQKWIVRVPRPVQQKLAPSTPLVTGQRVLDTFFPVAKGGTACIPGPFGSGKCVAGDTPVVLASGEILRIDELHARARKNGTVTHDGSDEWVRTRAPVRLYSLVGDRLVESETRTLYRGQSATLVRVKTRSGRTVRVTPIHRLFTFGVEGALGETPARSLRPGDYLASVRTLPSPTGRTRLRIELPKLQRRGWKITVPKRCSPELGEFLGLFVAEASVRANRTIVFANRDETLLGRFLDLTKSLFGLSGSIERRSERTPNVLVHSTSLVRLLDALGVGRCSDAKRIPPVVLASSNDVLAAFLRGYYLGEGAMYGGDVEFPAASRALQTELSYGLSRFGITSALERRVIDGVSYFRLFVRGLPNLARLSNLLASDTAKIARIGRYVESVRTSYTATDVVPLSPEVIEQVYRGHPRYSAPLRGGSETHNSIASGERMGAAAFSRFGATAASSDGLSGAEPAIFRLPTLLESLYCDEVVEVAEETDGPYDVYDCSLPEHGSNFVGGYGGLLLHNTVTQQQLAKWADSDVVIYVGCGERGNEMTEVLATFPHLQDPKSKRPLMERTVLIANTSNMPVAAREASVYTGITLAEYYRDMGYDVALMADSTSRWAEAMREISGRLEEMPGEEGYPAYLGRRIAEFYERAGRVVTLSPEGRQGSITVVGAVSPPGGDFSEPVSQNTLRVTRVFWALDAALASRRHFPSINWLTSYSLYAGELDGWYRSEIASDWVALRQRALEVLQKESELQEIVQLVGVDALPEREKGVLDVARMIREDYLQQSAYDEVDTYTSIRKQYRMLRAILEFGDLEQEAIGRGARVAELQKLPFRGRLSRMKWIPEKDIPGAFDRLQAETREAVARSGREEEGAAPTAPATATAVGGG
jgi:V/A-type H+-transporting ATPase subunit A